MNYRPRPIDISQVRLPSELEALSEQLAENTHEIWASQRLADGWTWGERRDDVLKQHPYLVPYAELPESEKLYDRRIVVELLKAVMKLGFQIEKKG